MSEPARDRVVLGRRESIPGEFANIYVEVELHARPCETTDELLERASRKVRQRLIVEYQRRNAKRAWWEQDAYEQARLDLFDTPEGS